MTLKATRRIGEIFYKGHNELNSKLTFHIFNAHNSFKVFSLLNLMLSLKSLRFSTISLRSYNKLLHIFIDIYHLFTVVYQRSFPLLQYTFCHCQAPFLFLSLYYGISLWNPFEASQRSSKKRLQEIGANVFPIVTWLVPTAPFPQFTTMN